MSKPYITNSKSPAARVCFLILFIFASLTLQGAVEIIPPARMHLRSVAIIIDRNSFEHTTPAVMAYKNMLEAEGLSAYVVIAHWDNPGQVRNEIIGLYGKQPRLEGVVLIGDIPVAMIRQGQHMTTAFKMNEETFPRVQSSVASDRFYDDLDLVFEYIGQDEEHTLWHYYNLAADSPQHISSDIYSGRIMPLKNGKDPYLQINNYLEKVVRLRRETNPVDHVFSFLGYASNSECMIAWASDKIALSQQFLQTNQHGNSLRYMSFGMSPDIKDYVMNELQRNELDIALMHKHGSIGIQHLSGTHPTSSFREYATRIQQAIHRIQQRDIPQDRKLAQLRSLGIPDQWLDHTSYEGELPDQKEEEARGNIYVSDLDYFSPNARLVLMDACYNGSFHHPENIAGAYIFNKGNTLVAIGNTVNVLQDNIPNQFIGTLSEGLRIGNIRKHINTLESHIIGDPTFRFSPYGSFDLDAFFALNEDNPAAWMNLLDSDNPDLIAFALMMLGKLSGEGHSDLLLMMFENSPWYTVRMESLLQLNRLNDQNYHQALKLAVRDNYELVRRLGTAWMGKKGHAEYIPLLVTNILEDPYFLRASVYNANLALTIFEPNAVIAEFEKQFALRQSMINRDAVKQSIMTSLNSNANRVTDWVSGMQNRDLEEDRRIDFIRFIRNSNYHHHTEIFTGIAQDKTESERIRLVMIEALGWFVHSVNKDSIIRACRQIAGDTANTETIRAEARKTLRRLGA